MDPLLEAAKKQPPSPPKLCVACTNPLHEFVRADNQQSGLFCENQKCYRWGLVTALYGEAAAPQILIPQAPLKFG